MIKNYLTSIEMSKIIEEIIHKKSAVEREIVKVGMVAQLVLDTKELGEFETCNEIYDKVMEKGYKFEEIVTNYNTIDKLVQEEIGINKFLEDFLIGFDEKLTKSIDGLDLNGAIKQLGDIANGKAIS